MINLYDSDLYGWTKEQVALLKAGEFDKLDLENLIEEVDELGNSLKHSLESQLIRLLQHLLKWKYQPMRIGRSWKLSIDNSRIEIDRLLERSPGLKSKLGECYDTSWKYAVRKAVSETSLKKEDFPDKNPWTIEKVLGEDWLP